MTLLLLFNVPTSWGFDFATETTQIMNNIELVINAERQLESLLNQAQMIENQILQLKSVATYQNVWVDIDANRSTLFNLVNQGYSTTMQIQNQLNQMKQQTQVLLNSGSLSDQQTQIGVNLMNVIQITLGRVSTSQQVYQNQENALQNLLQKNNAAVGQTQALQVLNQISAQNVSQMQSTQEAINNLTQLQAAQMQAEYQVKKDESDRVNTIVHQVNNNNSSFSFNP
jgi:P-type conjugative transfer protein TrbJ